MLLSPGFSDQIYLFGGGKKQHKLSVRGVSLNRDTIISSSPFPISPLLFSLYRQSGSTDFRKTQRKKILYIFCSQCFPIKSERSYQKHSVQLASPPPASPLQGSTRLGILGLRTRWMVSLPSSFLGQVPVQPALGSAVILKPHQTRCQKRSNPTGPLLPTKDALSLGELDSSLRRSVERLKTERSSPAKTPKALVVPVRCGANGWSHLTRYGLVVQDNFIFRAMADQFYLTSRKHSEKVAKKSYKCPHGVNCSVG